MIYYWVSCIIIYGTRLTALSFGIYNYKTIKGTSEKYFPHFITLTLIFDAIAIYMVWAMEISASKSSDIYGIIFISFIIWWYFQLLNNKLLLIVSIILLIVSYSLDLLYNTNIESEFPIRVVSSAIIVLISVFVFLQNQILNNQHIDYLKLRAFWISIGLLIYQVTLMPVLLFLPNLSRLDWELNLVLSFINIALYGCITYALSLKSNDE
ncbi:hypothetical protein LX97_02193 [Nonlabens dokdonensis]|jgi:hypothetical protein|uniref:Uncharacterized protein n=2 Tax=Nonlabens dokdonensis TaxID=328515 RepID=L7WBM1_NONDD|nr:hypothetical protein [Nonlabens dokdonensis]AGC77617.1 hypothetical protein DDD_2490 [Nonlabens dokdonensis DSW-6]PZX39835.1 hypothetical protein LX97_02193 [Nonlabens dokdonensis]